MFFHIHTAIWLEGYALIQQQFPLLHEMRRKPTGMVDHAVTGIIAVVFSHAQNLPNEPGIVLSL